MPKDKRWDKIDPASRVRIDGEVAHITLNSKGDEAIVDASDAQLIAGFLWNNSNGYAVSNSRDANGRRLRMHRIINKTPEGYDTDHINRNKLDNRRANLRTTSRSENSHNKDDRQRVKSPYPGVTRNNGGSRNTWIARIAIEGECVYLGNFKTPEAAYEAYKETKRRLLPR